MQKLEIKSNETGNYIEYKGVVLPFERTMLRQGGAYDAFDMNPAARSGGFTQYVHSFRVGNFTQAIACDSDNPAGNFDFWAKDIDDRHFEIVMTYYLSRGGDQECVIGKVSF